MASKIIAWIKANLLIVISCALIVILLPTGWFFSNSWNKSIQEKATKAFNDEKRRLSSASSIEYSLPAVLKGEEGISETRAPNTIVTNFYKEQKDQRESQVAEVVKRGTAFNQETHSVPVKGLLPEAKDISELRSNGYQLGQLIAGTQEAPSLYARLLRNLNAGDAPIPEVLAQSLNQYKEQQKEIYASTSPDGKVSSAQNDALDDALIQRRLGEYAGRAESIAFYCPLDAIQSDKSEPGFSHVPVTAPGYDSISDSGVYTWVWDYWVISDVLRAVAAANINTAGVALAVPDAPVKHVESIRVHEFVVASAEDPEDDFSTGGRGGRGGRAGSDPIGTAEAGIKTYTNRSQSNAYDIRLVDITVIASSKDLPTFFDALGKTNYMTVVDADLSQVNVWDALQRGYYYGDDHLVRAHLTIETVWLRSWTAPLMPEPVRTTLGVILESDNPDDFDG